jgi:hypothetical protein
MVQSVAVVQRAMRGRDPAEEMEEMGFGALYLVGSFPVSMSGQHTPSPPPRPHMRRWTLHKGWFKALRCQSGSVV